MKKTFLSLVLLLSFPLSLLAQHPIDVQRKSAEGDHFEALKAYEQLPKRRRTVASVLAAAKSSWALGLNKQAKDGFDEVLRAEELPVHERARTELYRGIIEYQEGNYQVAILRAEEAIETLASGVLRAKAWFLWADSLSALRSYGAAEEKYQKALEECSEQDKPEIYHRLGALAYQLGRYEDAKSHYEHIPLDHERTPETIRGLAKVALKLDNIEHAAFWLKKGREEYPDDFLDSWVDYAEVTVAERLDDLESVQRIRKEAEQKYPPSDPWLTLLQAAAESYEWKNREDKKKES